MCKCTEKNTSLNRGFNLMETLREILNDPNHPENYQISNMNDGRVQCHFCERSYAYVGSLKNMKRTKHIAKVPKPKTSKESGTRSDDVESYCNVLCKLTLLHKNLDSAVDMADGNRSVRSAKYELPVYNLTNKTKYAIGSIHLIALTV